MDMKGLNPTIYIADCELLNDLYVTKNKYVDKDEKLRNILYELFGDSIVFSHTN